MTKKEVSEIKRHLNVLKEHFDGRVMLIAEQYVDIKSDLGVIKQDLDIIKKNLRLKVDYDEFEGLEKRVLRLEKLGVRRHR